MKKTALIALPSFLESASTLQKEAKSKLVKSLFLLSTDSRHPGLHTKKIQGTKSCVFECRVDDDLRLVYDLAGGMLRCWYVGHHDTALRFGVGLSPSGIEVDDIELGWEGELPGELVKYLNEGITPTTIVSRSVEELL